MVVIKIAQSDTLVNKIILGEANPSFFFIESGDAVFYGNSEEPGQIYKTDRATLLNLGEGHKKLINNEVA